MLLWVVSTAEQRGDTVQKVMVSGGKSGRSSSQRRVRKADTQERLKPLNVNT